MAAGLMNQLAGDLVDVHSAGTKPGERINALSAESLAELGIDISHEIPKPITDEAIRAADVVVVLGRDAKVPDVEGTRIQTWETDEPSLRGIEGMERKRLVRDDIRARVQQLFSELVG